MSSLPDPRSVEVLAKAAFNAAVDEMGGDLFDTQRDAFCDGYETGVESVRVSETALRTALAELKRPFGRLLESAAIYFVNADNPALTDEERQQAKDSLESARTAFRETFYGAGGSE